MLLLMSLQRWYIDDGTFAGTRLGVAELLELLLHMALPLVSPLINFEEVRGFVAQWRFYFVRFSIPSEVCHSL